jgi:TetR/AcrR family transcriptional repressor of mexCD-oprJ operon
MAERADPTRPSGDHRRAIAERNLEAICDAAERLLEQGAEPTIAAVATESGLSRVTVYAHFRTRQELLEAVAGRAVGRCLAAFEAAKPEERDPVEALEHLTHVGWQVLDRASAVVRATGRQLPSERRRRLHEPVLAPIHGLIRRGQGQGAFRRDVPSEWLLACFYALVHAAADEVHAGRLAPEVAGRLLLVTVRDLFRGSPPTRARRGRSGAGPPAPAQGPDR